MPNSLKYVIGIFLFSVTIFVPAQDALNGDVNNGKAKFESICSACHLAEPRDKVLIGPGLEKAYSRLHADPGLDIEWFKKWVKNSQELVNAGDPYAVKVFNEFDKTIMTPNPISDQDVIDILTYLENPPKKEEPKAEAPSLTDLNKNRKLEENSTLMWIGFIGITAVLIAILLQVNRLVKLRLDPDLAPKDEEKIQSISDFYAKNQNLANILLGLILFLSLYGVWAFLFGIGVDKGYRPDQPIYFSHKIHAGINKIDCQVCHSGAKYGKVSEIPSANVCMNCHKAIKEYKGDYIEPGKDREFYNAQIQSLYDHVGWDGTNYTKPAKEIEWTRIHNMPDFVYFNHSQHVVVGEKTIIKGYNDQHPDKPIDVVCKACHGQVDTMNVVQMANDFTMEFCITCHRTTEVDMANGYNAAYFKNIHDKIAKNPRYAKDNKLTVDAVGGIECGKCHY